MYTAIDIAGHFLRCFGPELQGLTQMKLQKLVYYTKVWALVSGSPMVSDTFKHWRYGPVSPQLYDALKTWQGRNVESVDRARVIELSTDESQLITVITRTYGRLSAFTLSSLTHQEKPWCETKEGDVISDAAIVSFYGNTEFAKNFPFDRTKPFRPLRTHGTEAFQFDMDSTTRNELSLFPTFDDYVEVVKNAKLNGDNAEAIYKGYRGT